MIGDILQPTHLLFVLIVALLVLGPKRLPEVGRSLGRGIRDFRSAISGDDVQTEAIDPAPTATATPTDTSTVPAQTTTAPGPAAPEHDAAPEHEAVPEHETASEPETAEAEHAVAPAERPEQHVA